LNIDLSIDPKEVSVVIKDFIKTYVANSGCNGVVIGLSGGIDSAVTSILCREILGKKRTKCIFLPDNATPKSDIDHFKLLVKKFDLFYEIKDITNIVGNLKENCIITPNDLALANIKTRIRMLLLYEFANMTNSIVCGTSNKSELLVGYFTKFGDGGVDIMPIGDLYKTQIFLLANYLNIPKNIIEKPPTAGLLKDQYDKDELKVSYDLLDRLLICLEQKRDVNFILSNINISKSEIDRIKNLRKKSQHKRRTALIPKIGLRTPGLDWRSPIQEG
jgi:NAD+ synthase